MPKITISGIPGVNGDYPFDLEQAFTGDELHIIKKIAGIRVGEIAEAMEATDYDLIIAFAKIALDRAGRDDVPANLLSGLKVGEIIFGPTDEELAAQEEGDEDVPPTSAPLGASETSSPLDTSGKSSNGTSDTPPVSVRPSTGIPSLVESSDSVRGISAS